MSSFLSLSDNRRIAYHLTEGELPGVVFLGGFRSDMSGTKALALEDFCTKRGQRFLRFDYSGHGQSSGDFKDGTIGQWRDDALEVIDRLAPGKNILVGSSMGGWIMLLVALALPERVAALLGIASAPDFTERLVWNAFTDMQKKQVMEEGAVTLPDCYGDMPYLLTRVLIEEGRAHLLLSSSPESLAILGGSNQKNLDSLRITSDSGHDVKIPIYCPVRLLHGMDDKDVPWQMSVELMQRLASADVQITLVKGAGHRMSEPAEIALMCETVEKLLVASC